MFSFPNFSRTLKRRKSSCDEILSIVMTIRFAGAMRVLRLESLPGLCSSAGFHASISNLGDMKVLDCGLTLTFKPFFWVKYRDSSVLSQRTIDVGSASKPSLAIKWSVIIKPATDMSI